MKFLALIPARYASTRFPGKPLADLMGKPMIQHVYEKAHAVFEACYVATDDERIQQAVQAFGGKVVMTSEKHPSGTDRCREAWENVCRYAYTYDGGLRTRQAVQTQLYREWRDLASVHYADFVDGHACTITSEYEFWGGDAGTPARSHIPFLFNGELVIREAESIRLEYDNVSTVDDWAATGPLVRVYPNPSDGVFYLSTDWHAILSWQVYDLKGQLVKSQTLHYSTGVIDITELERGVYILRVQTTAGYQQQKLIKE